MKKPVRILKYVITAVLFFWFLSLPESDCLAASATINLSTNAESVNVGDEVTVNLSLSSEAMLGDFTAYITYNADILEFKNDASFIAGGDGLLKLTDKNTVNQETSRKYIMKFTAKTKGVSEIDIRDKAEIYELDTGFAMSVSNNNLEIKVSAAEAASDNTNLKTLKISPGELSPEFEKEKTEYTVDLKYEEDKLILSAVPEDDKASITIKGNENLAVGNNKISITVKAESGKEKEYIITAGRQKEIKNETDKINETDKAETDKDKGSDEYNSIADNSARIGKLSVFKDGDYNYIQNGYRYSLAEPEEAITIPEGYEKTSLILDGVSVTAYTMSGNPDSDFILLYAMNEDGETGFYQYDRKEATMQRYVKGREVNKVVMPEELMQTNEYKSKLTTMGIVVAITGAVCILLSVALIHMYLKKKDYLDN